MAEYGWSRLYKAHFVWPILQFSLLEPQCFKSRDYYFGDNTWYLTFSPVPGCQLSMYEIYLHRLTRHYNIIVKVSLSYFIEDGSEQIIGKKNLVLNAKERRLKLGDLEASVLKRHSKFKPSSELTFVCVMAESYIGDVTRRFTFPDPYNSEELAKALDERSSSLFHRSLERKQLNGYDHDVILRVMGEDFKAHRCILQTRSDVFARMFAHDMVEKNSGVVRIDDCDAATFGDFLRFVYTGERSLVSSANVFQLFFAADKYDLRDLRRLCIYFMRQNLTLASVCDVFRLSDLHGEIYLRLTAVMFFGQHTDKILESEEWINFLREDPDLANRLFQRSLQIFKRNDRKITL